MADAPLGQGCPLCAPVLPSLGPSLPGSNLPGMPKILIIDDEKAIRNALRDILEHEKHSVDEAEDGAAGLEKAKKGGYDVILCDIKMPKMDGLEFLQKLMNRWNGLAMAGLFYKGRERMILEIGAVRLT